MYNRVIEFRGVNMTNYKKDQLNEMIYLNQTIDFLKENLKKDQAAIANQRTNLIASRREMWEKAPRSANDFDKIPEMNQYLAEITYQTQNYERITERIKKYTQMLDTPYFGRFDFKEDKQPDTEKIYIGLYTLMNMDDLSIFVYDWRSPIAGMYYQWEVGRGSYLAPEGTISGEISLKRQYKIEKGKLAYFFDSNIQIKDHILREALSSNTTPTMRHIVETIQKEQDLIIRDTHHQLLIVQGVAGSGKTSIALHRIAFLLYTGMDSKLSSNHIMIISPNRIFSEYISSVLPQLGEDNVAQMTFGELASGYLGTTLTIESRDQMLESLILLHKHHNLSANTKRLAFKGSLIFKEILDRLVSYYEKEFISFEDVYYHQQLIQSKEQLRDYLLNDQTTLPLAKKLRRIKNIIMGDIYEEIEKNPFYDSDYDPELQQVKHQIEKFTQIDCLALYKLLFQQENLFETLARDLPLDDDTDSLITATKQELHSDYISYEDCAGILYLQLVLEGANDFEHIKHIVIDEAQDYYPLHYEIFKLLFNHTNFTVLGDINQTLERQVTQTFYDHVVNILAKKSSHKLSLNKGYRSSYEINEFSHHIIGNRSKDFESFSRHGSKPKVVQGDSLEHLHQLMMKDINAYQSQGYESVAVICKTNQEANKLKEDLPHGTLIVPAYMAKGLEFDAVLIYNVSKDHYSSHLDQKLLHIASTRALHQLSLYYVGEKSIFL